MKITVITGSPRKKGNSFAMTEAFVKAAEQRGHTIQRFDAAFLKIGGCHACMTCYKTGKACSFDDDFNLIAPAILESDAVVFSMPVYWYSIPAQIKGVIDRLFSLVVGGKDIAGKKCALITCCEEEDPTVMDGVRIPLERSAALLKWDMVGEVLVPGVLNEGEIEKPTAASRLPHWLKNSDPFFGFASPSRNKGFILCEEEIPNSRRRFFLPGCPLVSSGRQCHILGPPDSFRQSCRMSSICSLAHCISPFRWGSKDFPRGVNEYSTLDGTCGQQELNSILLLKYSFKYLFIYNSRKQYL